MRAAVVVLALSLSLLACGDNIRGHISVHSTAAFEPVVQELVAMTPYRGLDYGLSTDGYQIEVFDDATIPLEGYRLKQGHSTIGVFAHDILGAQYGVSAALESLGMRFRHPYDPYIPRAPVEGDIDTALHQPQVRVRGYQFHTLHPIEPYFALWEPGQANTYDAHRIIDWVVKNRGNFLQWVALDNIMKPDAHDAWQPFTRELIDYAHSRGVRVGLNIQLFGKSNLQLAFDLSDDDPTMVPVGPSTAARLPLIMKDLPFDVFDISFGEFFAVDPQIFIDSLDEAYHQIHAAAPAAEVHAYIHVGGTDRVMYMGEDLIYYFLVKFADPGMIHDIHSVMFYNLFEPTGGAYKQDNFFEARDYLRQRMCDGKRGSYQPEDAYWVAFDDSVPQYFPLYIRSRLYDLAKLREPGGACGTLDQHVLFSTGWEWDYWMNDTAAMRASYELPATTDDAILEQLAPDMAAAAPLIARLADSQHDHVMIEKLTGYLIGRDSIIDLGRTLNPPIISQPDRITFAQLANGQGRAEVEAMLPTMRTYAGEVEGLASSLDALDLPDSRWTRELRAGFHIDAVRARYVQAMYEAALAHLDGDDAATSAATATATKLLAQAKDIVHGRDADLHDDHGRRLLDKTANQTFYQYGYLYFADTLCYWQRELDQLGNMTGASTAVPSSCFF